MSVVEEIIIERHNKIKPEKQGDFKMTSIVKHYKIQKDGSLKFVGIERTRVEERPARPTRGPVIDSETMRKLGDIAYNGQVNPDDREV